MLLEMDSLVLVDLLKNGAHSPRYISLLHKHELLQRNWRAVVKHIFKEANRFTDKLANMGLQGILGVQWLTNPPLQLLDILRQDFVGVAMPRNVRL